MSTVLCTQMQIGDCVRYRDVPIRIMRDAEECPDIFGRTEMRYWAKREDTGQEGYINFGLQATLELERIEGHECAYCDEEFSTEPVRDLDEVTWRGDQARTWCSEECMVKYAERAASNEPLGRSDPR